MVNETLTTLAGEPNGGGKTSRFYHNFLLQSQAILLDPVRALYWPILISAAKLQVQCCHTLYNFLKKNLPFLPAKLLLNSFWQIRWTLLSSVPCHNWRSTGIPEPPNSLVTLDLNASYIWWSSSFCTRNICK